MILLLGHPRRDRRRRDARAAQEEAGQVLGDITCSCMYVYAYVYTYICIYIYIHT